MAIATDPEHHEIDRRLVEQRLVAFALAFGVGRGAIQATDGAKADPRKLAAQVGAIAALVLRPEPGVLVELE